MSKIARIIDKIWLGRADYDLTELAEHNIEQIMVVAKEIDNKFPHGYSYDVINTANIKGISFREGVLYTCIICGKSYCLSCQGFHTNPFSCNKIGEVGMELEDVKVETYYVYSHKFDIEDDKEIDDNTLFNIFDIIHDIIQTRKRVLIHCQGGMSRSPAIIIGYLMYLGMSYSEALAFVQWRLGEKWPIFPAHKTMDSIRKYFKEI